MKTAIVTTTINVPVLIEDYIKDIKYHHHDCFFVVIGDKKTPPETKDYCNKIQSKHKIDIHCLNVEDQLKYLKKFPELAKHLTYNSIQRRNIGMIFAYEAGADMIITIDDDNFFASKNFVEHHLVGFKRDIETISSNTGWLNVCDFLKEKYNRRFYHRGFPPEYRFLKEKKKTTRKKVKIVVNAGFWLGDPDVDALTRLYFPNQPITAVSYKRKDNFALAKNSWSPFNSQNTSLAREVIPAYFLSPYTGHYDEKQKTFVIGGRYDDIWASYIIKRIADHLNHYISYGQPLVYQKRNPHNYWKDLIKEDTGMRLTDFFTKTLREIRLTKSTYKECFKELTNKLEKTIPGKKLNEGDNAYLKKYVEGMKVWVKTFERVANT